MVTIRRRKNAQAAAPPVQIDPEDQQNIMSAAGSAVMSGLHKVGSLLSYPSRVLYGTANYLTGGERGFGDNILNPLDSRGGVEASEFLIRAGMLPRNDPEKWEWSDLGRGLADIAGDPMTWAIPFGMTKAGVQASSKGTQAAGRVAQTAAGERALLTLAKPFSSKPFAEFGTGPQAAKIAEAVGKYTGLTPISRAIKEGPVGRYASAMFDWTKKGLTHPTIQKYITPASKSHLAFDREVDAEAIRIAKRLMDDGVDPDTARMVLEGVAPLKMSGGRYIPQPQARDASLVTEPHEMAFLSPQSLASGLLGRKYVPHPVAKGSDEFTTILADAKRLEQEWAKDADEFLPPSGMGKSEVPGRREDFRNFLQSGKDIEQPHVVVDAAGRLAFNDGRHRTRVLLDEGDEFIPLTVRTQDADAVRKLVTDDYLDDVLKSGSPEVTAPFVHLNKEGKLVAGPDVSRIAGKTARQQHSTLRKALRLQKKTTTDPDKIVEINATLRSMGKAGIKLDKATAELDALRAVDTANFTDVAKSVHAQSLKKAERDVLKAQRAVDDIAQRQSRIESEMLKTWAPDTIRTINKMAALGEPGIGVMLPKSQLQQAQELFGMGGKRSVSPLAQHHELEAAQALNRAILERNRELGIGNQDELVDIIQQFPRRKSRLDPTQIDATSGVSRGSRKLPAKTSDDAGREMVLKGFYEGTAGVNKVLPVAAQLAAKHGKDVSSAAKELESMFGPSVIKWYQTIKQQRVTGAAQRRLERAASKLQTTTDKRILAQEELDGLRSLDTAGMDDAALAAHKSSLSKAQRSVNSLTRSIEKATKNVEGATAAVKHAQSQVRNRFKDLIQYASRNPELADRKLFGNTPIDDLKAAALGHNTKRAMAPAVYSSIAEGFDKGDAAVTVKDFLKKGRFEEETAVRQIAERMGKDATNPKVSQQILAGKIDSNLAKQLEQLTDAFKAPQAVSDAGKALKSGMAWWKALTLAFPASRVRDMAGGLAQNILHGWADKKFILDDVRKLMRGDVINRSYEHVPEIQEWLAKSQLPWSPENQTEALRQLVATHFPNRGGMMAEIPKGQVGATYEDMLRDVPGQEPTRLRDLFFTDPVRELTGRGQSTWFGTPQAGETTADALRRAATHQFTGVRGFGDTTNTTFAPVRASEMVAESGDLFNRAGPFLQQLHGGTRADVASDLVNRAQVNYDPRTFTPTERWMRDNVFPFYAFSSRMVPETARQLSHMGSPTSQLVKALDRAQGGDVSVPDYITAGTATPLGTADDGTKRFLSTAGLMHEPAVSMLGLLAAAPAEPAAGRALGYDMLAQINPLLGGALQRITGQSFFQRGTNIADLDPTTGRLLSNIGESVGLRDQDEGPVRYPGAAYVDALLGYTPYGRLLNQARTLADPRKGIGAKLVDTLSGARITDVSPDKQIATMLKRVEDLARSEGAFESRMVGFPQEQIGRVAEWDPAAAQRMQDLQNLLTSIKRQKISLRKKRKAEKAAEE